jgi:hypothetical protein
MPCTKSASRLKRPGRSESRFVGEIDTLLHGDLPGSLQRTHGARGCLGRNEGLWPPFDLSRVLSRNGWSKGDCPSTVAARQHETVDSVEMQFSGLVAFLARSV